MINLKVCQAALELTAETGAPLMTYASGFHLLADQEPKYYQLGHARIAARAKSLDHILRRDFTEGVARSLGYQGLDKLLQWLGPPSGDPWEVYTLVRLDLELS